MVVRYNISGFHTLVNTNDGYLVKHSDYEALEQAARRLVDHAKNSEQELWASLPDILNLSDVLDKMEDIENEKP